MVIEVSSTGGSVCIGNSNLTSHDICLNLPGPQPILLLPAFLTTTALKCSFIVGSEFVEFPFES